MKHNRAAAPAWPVPRHALAGTRGNSGGVTLQFREVFERFVINPDYNTLLFMVDGLCYTSDSERQSRKDSSPAHEWTLV